MSVIQLTKELFTAGTARNIGVDAERYLSGLGGAASRLFTLGNRMKAVYVTGSLALAGGGAYGIDVARPAIVQDVRELGSQLSKYWGSIGGRTAHADAPSNSISQRLVAPTEDFQSEERIVKINGHGYTVRQVVNLGGKPTEVLAEGTPTGWALRVYDGADGELTTGELRNPHTMYAEGPDGQRYILRWGGEGWYGFYSPRHRDGIYADSTPEWRRDTEQILRRMGLLPMETGGTTPVIVSPAPVENTSSATSLASASLTPTTAQENPIDPDLLQRMRNRVERDLFPFFLGGHNGLYLELDGEYCKEHTATMHNGNLQVSGNMCSFRNMDLDYPVGNRVPIIGVASFTTGQSAFNELGRDGGRAEVTDPLGNVHTVDMRAVLGSEVDGGIGSEYHLGVFTPPLEGKYTIVYRPHVIDEPFVRTFTVRPRLEIIIPEPQIDWDGQTTFNPDR